MLPLRTTNRVQPIADPDKLLVTSTLRNDLLKERIKTMVKNVKESSAVQTWAAPVLLALVLSYSVYSGQAMTSELKELNRAVVVLQTEKNELEKQTERERQEKFQLVREQEAWREKMKNEMIELRYALRDKLPRKEEQ